MSTPSLTPAAAAVMPPAVAAAAGAAAPQTAAAPLNEAQIKSAVTFLTKSAAAPHTRAHSERIIGAQVAGMRWAHSSLSALLRAFSPKVASSPISRRVSFLLGKGLTAAEICEALRRVAPNSPEHLAMVEGIAQGKSATECVAGLDATTATTSPAAAPVTSTPSAGVPPVSYAPSPSYPLAPAPPGFVAGPPAYPGGPPTFYQLPSQAHQQQQPAVTSWARLALTTATVLGGIATAGYVAKRALGLELSSSHPAFAGTALAPAASTSAGLLGSSGSSEVPPPIMSNAASLLPPAVSSSAAVFPSGDHRLARNVDESSGSSSGSSDDEDEEPEQKYLGAWLGGSDTAFPATTSSKSKSRGKKSSKRKSKRQSSAASAAVASQLSAVGDKLDLVVEALRDNQTEWRKMGGGVGGSNKSGGDNAASNAKLEALLTSSIQTQNEMLATLKIMMSAQAKAAAAAHAAQAAAAAGLPPQPSPVSSSAFSSDQSHMSTAPAAAPKSWIEQNLGSAMQDGSLAFNNNSSSGSGAPGSSPAAIVSAASSSGSFFGAAPSPAPGSLTAPPSSGDPVADGLLRLDESLSFLRASNTPEDVRSALSAMILYIDNLLANMSNPRYRKILMSNSSYESRVRKTKGAERVMLAAGFEIRAPYIEWVMPDSSSDTPALASGSLSDGTGTGITMDEAQKTRLLQEASVILKATRAAADNTQANQQQQGGYVPPLGPAFVPSQPYSPALPQAMQQQPQQSQQSQSQPPQQQQQQQPQQQPSQPPAMMPQQSFSSYGAPNQSYNQPMQQPQQHQQLSSNFTHASIYDANSVPLQQFQPQQQQQQQQPQLVQPQPQAPPSAYQQSWMQQPQLQGQQQASQQPSQPQLQQQSQTQPQSQPQFQTPPPAQRQPHFSPSTWQQQQDAQQQMQQQQGQPQQMQQPQPQQQHIAPHSQPATPWQPPPTQSQSNGVYAAQAYSQPTTPLGPPQFSAAQQQQNGHSNGGGAHYTQQQQQQQQPSQPAAAAGSFAQSLDPLQQAEQMMLNGSNGSTHVVAAQLADAANVAAPADATQPTATLHDPTGKPLYEQQTTEQPPTTTAHA